MKRPYIITGKILRCNRRMCRQKLTVQLGCRAGCNKDLVSCSSIWITPPAGRPGLSALSLTLTDHGQVTHLEHADGQALQGEGVRERAAENLKHTKSFLTPIVPQIHL